MNWEKFEEWVRERQLLDEEELEAFYKGEETIDLTTGDVESLIDYMLVS